MQETRKALIASSLFAALITFIIYIPAFGNGFVSWDDPKYVYENAAIQNLNIAFLKRAFTEVYFSNWHPLTMISYAVDYALWGLNPAGYHVENVLIHAINTALVAILSLKLITSVRPLSGPAAFAAGFFPALLFGIHPLHVESVAWISERKDVLCTLFFIPSVLFYLRYARERKISCYILSLASFVLAIMSKSMAVTLPMVLLLIDFYPLKRLSGAKAAVKGIAEKVPFFAVSAFAAAMAVYSQSSAMASLDAVPFDLRIYSALRAYVFYLEKFFVPLGLAPIHPLPTEIDPFGPDYLVSYGILAGLTIISLVAMIRYRAFITAWLYYLGTLVPVIGLVQVGAQAAADRYMYLPSLSLLILLGAGAALVIEKNSKPLLGLLAAAAVLATVGLSYMTVQQSSIWKDSLTLWDYEIRVYPNASIPYTNRGVTLVKMGELDKGLSDLEKAISLAPRSRNALYNRALALKTAGRYEEALSDLDKAIAIRADADALNNRGNVRKNLGDIKGAIEDYRASIVMNPANAATYYNLALLQNESGDIDGAIDNASKAASLGMGKAMEYLDYLESRLGAPSLISE